MREGKENQTKPEFILTSGFEREERTKPNLSLCVVVRGRREKNQTIPELFVF
jgi:hypothetical protein